MEQGVILSCKQFEESLVIWGESEDEQDKRHKVISKIKIYKWKVQFLTG